MNETWFPQLQVATCLPLAALVVAPLLISVRTTAMPVSAPPPTVLDRVYLEVRAKLLEVAASLDRIDRAEDSAVMQQDPRLDQIHQAIEILKTGRLDRAEQIQMAFSDAYVSAWPRPKAR